MDFSEMFDSKYVKAADLKGVDVVVTIQRVEKGSVESTSGKASKAICKVAEFEKPVVLNVTNCKRIAKLYGRTVEQWIGKQVTLYTGEAEVGGEIVPCIRVRPDAPAATGPQLAKTA
jgi:hypothetical protein